MTISRRLYIQLFACSVLLGLYPVVSLGIRFASKHFFSPLQTQLYQQVLIFFYPEKKIELVSYLVFIFAFSLYGAGAYLISLTYDDRGSVARFLRYPLAVSFIVNALLWFHPFQTLSLLWPMLAMAPVILGRVLVMDGDAAAGGGLSERTCARTHWIAGLVSLLALIAMLVPLLVTRPHIESEYLNIPTTTKISDNDLVDSTGFCDSDKFLAITRFDFHHEVDYGKRFPSVEIAMTDNLKELLVGIQHSIPGYIKRDLHDGPRGAVQAAADDARADAEPESILYDHGRLVAIDVIPVSLEVRLMDAVGVGDHNKIGTLVAESHRAYQELRSHRYSQRELSFIRDNDHELKSQVLARKIIHHQNFMLGSIQEMDKGRPLSEVNLQYGYLPILFFQKLLHFLGGVSFSAYFHILNSFYIWYVVSATVLLRFMTKDLTLSLIYLGFSVFVIGLAGYETLIIAPGMNPIRHALDVFAIVVSFQYCRTKNLMLLLGAFGLCILSLYINVQSGLSLTVAILAGLAASRMTDSSGYRRVPLLEVLGLLVALVLAFKFQPGRNELSKYYFEGLLGFPTHVFPVIAFISLCIAAYFILIRTWTSARVEDRTTLLILLLYSQLMFVYYVWGGTKFHLMNYLSIYMLTFLFAAKLACEHEALLKFKPLIFTSFLQLVTIAICFSTAFYLYQEVRYASDFSCHVSHAWDSRKMDIVSTMPERDFASASALINKYDQDAGIYIISEFDNILPFYSDKYSAMPYPDLQWFINSDVEKARVIDTIHSVKPKYLFVDTQMDRNMAYDIVGEQTPPDAGIREESILRVHRLRVLQEIFDALKDGYALKETGGLIDVWERVR